MAEPGGRNSRPVSIEDVVEALSAQCDGARSRDGRGFSRADSVEGGRLSAMKRRGMAWSVADARKAQEIVARYSIQASVLLGRGVEAREKGIQAAIRHNRVGLREDVVAERDPVNYCCLSPGGKQAHFWRLAHVDDLGSLVSLLRTGASRPHGERRNHMRADAKAEITLNGARRRAARIEVDWNGTTLPCVLEAARLHGFLVEPAMEGGVDAEIDGLRRRERAAWVHRGVRDGRKGAWAVFDLARRHDPFSEEVKRSLRGRFACLEHDDWNWYVELDAATLAPVARLVRNHGFAFSEEMRRIFAAARARASGSAAP